MARLRAVVCGCAALPWLPVVLVRCCDAVFFNPVFNKFLSPIALGGLFFLWALGLVRLSAARPLTAAAAAALVFAVLKHYADDIAPPVVGTPGTPLVAMVTGANSGIGYGVTAQLARQGHTVIMACRSSVRCEAAAAAIAAETSAGHGKVVAVGGLDLASLSSIDSFVAGVPDILRRHNLGDSLDMFVANAGFVPVGNATTVLGWEAGLGSMHLGHSALVLWLVEAGVLTRQTSLVMVSSDAARVGGFHNSLFAVDGEGDLRGEVTMGCSLPAPVCVPRRAMGFVNIAATVPDDLTLGAYGRAKLANALFAREMHRRGLVGKATAVHPGMVVTNIITVAGLEALQEALTPLFLRPRDIAGNVVLHAAVDPLDYSHDPVGPRDPFLHFFGGRGELLGAASLDFKSVGLIDQLARRLWDVSEEHLAKYRRSAVVAHGDGADGGEVSVDASASDEADGTGTDAGSVGAQVGDEAPTQETPEAVERENHGQGDAPGEQDEGQRSSVNVDAGEKQAGTQGGEKEDDEEEVDAREAAAQGRVEAELESASDF